MKEVLEQDKGRREQLAELYKEAEGYIGRLPTARHRELEKCIPDIGDTLTNNITNLRKSDCAILIAGECYVETSSMIEAVILITKLYKKNMPMIDSWVAGSDFRRGIVLSSLVIGIPTEVHTCCFKSCALRLVSQYTMR